MPRAPMKINNYKQKSNYVPRTLNLVNLRHLQSDFREANESPEDYLSGRDSGVQDLGITEQQRQMLMRMYENLKSANTDSAMMKTILESGLPDGKTLPANYEGIIAGNTQAQTDSILRYFHGSKEEARQAAMDLVEFRAATNDASSLSLSADYGRHVEKEQMKALGFKEITYVERFPMLLACPGYQRLPHGPDPSTFNSYVDGGKRTIYVEPYNTEAIIFELNPEALLAVVQAWCPGFEIDSTIPLSIQLGSLMAQHRSRMIAEPGLNVDLDDPGLVAWTTMHSLMHIAIKAISGPSGFNVNTFSEYAFPGGLAFAVFLNRQQETGIGGLMSVFKDGLHGFLQRFKGQDQDCLHDPKCRSNSRARCHACLIMSETSCRAFNTDLDRHLIYGWDGKAGFWS